MSNGCGTTRAWPFGWAIMRLKRRGPTGVGTEQLPQSLWDDYKKIFHELLPDVCARLILHGLTGPALPVRTWRRILIRRKLATFITGGVAWRSSPSANMKNSCPRFMSELVFSRFPNSEPSALHMPEDRDIKSAE